MDIEEIKTNLISDEESTRKNAVEALNNIVETDLHSFETNISDFVELLNRMEDKWVILQFSVLFRDNSFSIDHFPFVLQSLDLLADRFPMDSDEDFVTASCSNLLQSITQTLNSNVQKFQEALPVLLKLLDKKSYIRTVAFAPMQTWTFQQPKLLVPHTERIFELVKKGFTDFLTPLTQLYELNKALFETQDHVDILVNIGTTNMTYGSLALNILSSVSKNHPNLLKPHVSVLAPTLNSMTTASVTAMIFAEVAREFPEEVLPYVDTLVEAGNSIPNLKFTLPKIFGNVGVSSPDAAKQSMIILNKYMNEGDQNLLMMTLIEVKRLANVDKTTLDPVIDKIKEVANDPGNSARDQAKNIVDLYEGRDLDSLMNRFEDLNKEVKASVNSMDDLRSYVDRNVRQLKEFMAEVSKKLPIPYEFTTEGKFRKTMKLHFACGCQEDRCLYPKERSFTSETKEINKWIKVAFSATKIGASVVAGLGGDVVGHVKDMYHQATGKPDEEFLAIVNEPFITSQEQDYLIDQLRSSRFFDFFNYNAQKANWCCIMCMPK